jgi:chromate reductase
MEIVEHEIGDLPFYDAGLEAGGDPEPVAAFKRAIAEADAVLIATPEYNRSVPGVLKNAIDWASRPPLGSPLAGKRVGVMGASTGMSGTSRAQAHLLSRSSARGRAFSSRASSSRSATSTSTGPAG